VVGTGATVVAAFWPAIVVVEPVVAVVVGPPTAVVDEEGTVDEEAGTVVDATVVGATVAGTVVAGTVVAGTVVGATVVVGSVGCTTGGIVVVASWADTVPETPITADRVTAEQIANLGQVAVRRDEFAGDGEDDPEESDLDDKDMEEGLS
jgi:hypothetical protein